MRKVSLHVNRWNLSCVRSIDITIYGGESERSIHSSRTRIQKRIHLLLQVEEIGIAPESSSPRPNNNETVKDSRTNKVQIE